MTTQDCVVCPNGCGPLVPYVYQHEATSRIVRRSVSFVVTRSGMECPSCRYRSERECDHMERYYEALDAFWTDQLVAHGLSADQVVIVSRVLKRTFRHLGGEGAEGYLAEWVARPKVRPSRG